MNRTSAVAFPPLLLPIIFTLLLVTTACLDETQTTAGPNSQPDTVQASYITAGSLAELVGQSSVIVIGHVAAKGEIVNMARNPENVDEPDASLFGVGQIYEVKVERYLKGNAGDVIDVLQAEGLVNLERLDLTDSAIQQSRAVYPHVPMDQNARYLIFLKQTRGFPGKLYMTGTVHPWRFILGDDGMASPESPWHGAEDKFPPTPSEQFTDEIEALVDQAD